MQGFLHEAERADVAAALPDKARGVSRKVHHRRHLAVAGARVDHEVEDEEIPGVVVSRVNLSPKFMRELIDAMQDNYSKWQTREGIKNLPEFGGGRGAPGEPGSSEYESDDEA